MSTIFYKNKPYGSGSSSTSSNDYTAGTGIQISEDNTISTKDIKKNYIDNSNFRINQTGQSEYTTTSGTLYTVDRWYIDGGTLSPTENGIQFVNPNTESGSSNLVRLKQNIGYSFAEFAGKTLTLSAKINGTVYTGTATLPTEKPTEGTAVQYIAKGIADFGINLNYSITGDYFVPYLALAYSKTVEIEWMKLEVNDGFSGYVEPDYTTELIKINMITNDKGDLDLPTGGESYDDTEIKASLENKLDVDGYATGLKYSVPIEELTEDPTKEVDNNNAPDKREKYYGELIKQLSFDAELGGRITCIKKVEDKIFIGGAMGFGYVDNKFENYTSILNPNSPNINLIGNNIIDIIPLQDSDYLVLTQTNGAKPFLVAEDGTITDWIPSPNTMPLYCGINTWGVRGREAFFICQNDAKVYMHNDYNFTEFMDFNEQFGINSSVIQKIEKERCTFLIYQNEVIVWSPYYSDFESFSNIYQNSMSNITGDTHIMGAFINGDYIYIITDRYMLRKKFDFEVGYAIDTHSVWEDYGYKGEINNPLTTIFFGKSQVSMYAVENTYLYYPSGSMVEFLRYGKVYERIEVDSNLPHSYYLDSNDQQTEFTICTLNGNMYRFSYQVEDKSMMSALYKMDDLKIYCEELEIKISDLERELTSFREILQNNGLI